MIRFAKRHTTAKLIKVTKFSYNDKLIVY